LSTKSDEFWAERVTGDFAGDRDDDAGTDIFKTNFYHCGIGMRYPSDRQTRRRANKVMT